MKLQVRYNNKTCSQDGFYLMLSQSIEDSTFLFLAETPMAPNATITQKELGELLEKAEKFRTNVTHQQNHMAKIFKGTPSTSMHLYRSCFSEDKTVAFYGSSQAPLG